jgi:hypothetical protein
MAKRKYQESLPAEYRRELEQLGEPKANIDIIMTMLCNHVARRTKSGIEFWPKKKRVAAPQKGAAQ